MLDPWTLPPHEQVFSWTNPDTGQTLHFAASTLATHAAVTGMEIIAVVIDPEAAEMIGRERGIERGRLNECLRLMLKTNAPPPPVLFVEWADGSGHLLVDGSHRFLAAHIAGYHSIPARIVPEQMAREFLIDLPENLPLPEWSGIPSPE